MRRWYEQRKPVDLIEACRAEADSLRPAPYEHPRLKPGGAVTAGGWCAPAEVIYHDSILNANGSVAVSGKSLYDIKMEAVWG